MVPFCPPPLQVFYGLLKEPEIEVPLDDEDEEVENEEGKPKKKKPKKDSLGNKSKKQDPNAPQQNRSAPSTLLRLYALLSVDIDSAVELRDWCLCVSSTGSHCQS